MFEFVRWFIRRFSLRKFFKNKLFVLVIAVFILCGVAYGVDKAIDRYSFYDDGSGEEVEEDLESGELLADDEVDLVLEEFDESVEVSGDESDESGEVVEGESEIVDGDDGVSVGTSSGDEEESGEESSAEVVADSEEERDDDKVESTEVGTSATEDEDTRNKIYVYITGEVVVPGVVILDEGSRISDAINAAGGTTVNANVSKVNLVYVLQDGMKVNIPNNSDLKSNPNFEYITTASGDGRNDVSSNYGKGDSSGSGTSDGGSSKRQEIVNINTASQTELESLPGIGPSLALKIINYRKENGKFSSIEDIKNVSGIGESKFEVLKEFIRV